MRILFLAITLSLLVTGCVSTTPKIQKWDVDERADVHIKLGLDYLQRNELQVAGEEFEQALQADSRADGAYHGLALIKIKQGALAEAVPLFEKAVRLNPDNFVARNDFGTFLCGQGRVKEGFKQLEVVLENPLNNSPIGTYLGMAICNEQAASMTEAQEYYRKVLSIAPTLPQALLPMARINYRQGERLSARAFIERYLGAGYSSAEALLLAAQIEHDLGDRDQTRYYAKRLWRRYPKSSEAEQVRRIEEN